MRKRYRVGERVVSSYSGHYVDIRGRTGTIEKVLAIKNHAHLNLYEVRLDGDDELATEDTWPHAVTELEPLK